MKLRKSILSLIAFIGVFIQIYGQCTDGSQPECRCNTAPVLCTIDELDGYMFTMDGFLHPQDGPSPLCPGFGCSCIPHNPTWFAFTAWCTELDLIAEFSNCTQVGGDIGVQVAIYSNCTSYTPVDCNVSSADCGNTNDKTLNLTGLEIGSTYYFLIDGCNGSYCDVTIDVIGTCGMPTIDPWINPVSGPDYVCAGDTETYTVDDLVGANTYHWYLDGVEIGTSTDPNFNINWPNEGTFELCVDASNDPCIPVTDPPAQICMTITVYDPEAGMITATPDPLCPGETSTITVTGFNSNPDLSQYLIVVDPNNIVVEVINGSSTTLSYNDCGVFTVYAYNFITADNPTLPVVGQSYTNINCNNDCCDIEEVTVRFEDDMPPQFISTPPDESLECIGLLPSAQDLEYQDNCLPNAFVSPTESGSPDLCSGGTLTRTWEAMDSCGNDISHVQTITVDPLAAPDFINPPADITVDCNSIPGSFADLNYNNNAVDALCIISGSVSPTVMGTLDICSGSATVTWEYTDTCGRTITHDQIISITPPSAPSFTNPPADITLSCANAPTMPPPDLTYSNGQSGNCEISGSVPAVVSGSADICGGSYTYTWDYTDTCGRNINHVQNVTVDPSPQAAFVSLPADITLPCSSLPLPPPPDLSYENGETGVCEISGVVSPIISGTADECGGTVTYTWEFTDACSRTISHTQTITVEPAPPAVFDQLPQDMTLDCSSLPLPPPPDLNYDNGESGICAISGTISPTVNGSPDECGGSVTYAWEYTDACSRTITHQQVITVNPSPQAAFVNPPSGTTLTCDQFENNNIPNLNYTNNESGICEISGSVPGTQVGTVDYCGSTISYEWTFTDDCNRTISHSQTINVEAAPMATFVNVPADITINCEDAGSLVIPTVSYNNGLSGTCQISGTVSGLPSGVYNECGGLLRQTWAFTDACGRFISSARDIVVNPAAPPQWVNPPTDITVSCADVENLNNELDYDNGEGGACASEGTVEGIITGSYDACGGTLNQDWNYTDACGNTINHSRSIQVEPAPPASFLNPPVDVTLECGTSFPAPYEIMYSNNANGNCLFEGTVLSDVVINGNIATYTWTYTDPCNGNDITHTQIQTQTLSPDLQLSPATLDLCEGSFIDLSQISISDLNNTNPTFTFYEGFPPVASNEITDLNFQVSSSTIISIVGSSSSSCADTVQLMIEMEDRPNAGLDGVGEVCDSYSGVPLWNFLGQPFDGNGIWTSPHSNIIDISNPGSVSFNFVPTGNYDFYYIVPGTPICPPDTALVTLTVLEAPEISIISVDCDPSGSTYSVIVELSPQGNINVSAGTVSGSGSQFTISNIPIGENLDIEASLPNGICISDANLTAPDCNCPTVPLPITPGPVVICQGEEIPELTVDVDPGYSVNWFDQSTGGSLLLSGSTSYLPTVSGPGIYTFYVQSYSIPDSCLSASRAAVTLEIRSLPTVNSVEVSACGSNGFVEFDLVDIAGGIIGVQNSTVDFYVNLEDAVQDTNELVSPYQNMVPDSQLVYFRLTSSNSCFVIDSVLFKVNPNPQLNVDVQDERCFGDENGQIITSVSGGTPPFEFQLNGDTTAEGPDFDSLSPGFYTISVTDSLGCVDNDSVDVLEGQQLTMDILALNCNDNSTSSDTTDDYYEVILLVKATQGGTYQFTSNDTTINGLNYGDTLSLVVAAGDTPYTLSAIDDLNNCSIEQVLTDLGHCSSDCDLTFATFEYSCNNNGTPTDPSDDFYDFTLVVEGINTGSNGLYSVRIDNVLINNFPYGDTITFTRPASGNSSVIRVSDSQITACSLTETLSNLDPCSDDCAIDIINLEIVCDDAGTQNDDSDDFYNATLLIEGANTGSNGWQSSTGQSGSYGDTIIIGPFLISDGDTTISISDLDLDSCESDLTLSAPPPCSAPCELDVSYSILNCFNNMTGRDTTDDLFDISLVVTSINGPTTRYTVTAADSITFGPYNYGDTITLDGLPANGDIISIVIVDDISGQCNISFTVSQSSCSVCNGSLQAGPDVILSCGQNSSFIFALASGANNISWSGPRGYFEEGDSVLVDAPGEYIVTASFDNNCLYTDTVEVTLDDDIPVAIAGPDGLINCLVDSFILQNLSGNTNQDIIPQWADESGNVLSNENSFVTRDSGIYFLRLIDTVSQCTSAVDRVIVTKDTHKPNAFIYAEPDSIFNCIVTSIELSGEIEANSIYRWRSDDLNITSRVINVTKEGTYDLLVVDTISQCEDTASIILDDFSKYPEIQLNLPDTLTCKNGSALLDASSSFMADSITYQWLDNNNNVLVSDSTQWLVSTGGVYIFRSEDLSNGCINTDTVVVPVDSAQLELRIEGQTNLPCGVDSTYLNVIDQNANQLTIINWSTDSGMIIFGTQPSSIFASGAGTYSASAEHPTSGCISDASVIVRASEALMLSAVSIDSIYCKGETASIEVEQISGTPPFELTINSENIEVGERLSGLSPGQYILHAVDNNGCQATDTVQIQEGREIIVDLNPVIRLTRGDSTVIEAIVNLMQFQIDSIFWRPEDQLSCSNCLRTIITALNNEQFEITVIDENGCEGKATFSLIVLEPQVNIFIPNTITPNGDGINDGLTLFSEENITIENMLVYDRWGNLMVELRDFPANNPVLGWDGTFKSQEVNPGVYVYSIEYRLENGELRTAHGDVTVTR